MLRLVRAALVQIGALFIAWYVFAPALEPDRFAALAALTAVLLARLMRFARWSALLHGVLIPLIVLAWMLHLPGWAYLLAMLLTYGLYRNAWHEQVPLYRSCQAVALELGQELAQGCHVLEAGAGEGRLTFWLLRARPDLKLTAMENAWASFLWAKARWYLAGRPSNVRLVFGSFWQADWQDYDAIYVFLSPTPMEKVWHKFHAQARPGAVLISNTFAIPGVDPVRSLSLPGRLQQSLLVWQAGYGSE